MEVKVLAGQSLIDLAITYLGNAEAVYDIALENNLSINEALISGQNININTEVVDKDVVTYYYNNGIEMATSITAYGYIRIFDKVFDIAFE